MILRTQVPAKAIDNDTEAILDNFFSSILDPSVELVSHASEGINGVVRVIHLKLVALSIFCLRLP